MSLPENVGTGWVTGTFLAGDLTGTPVAGSITFTPSAKSVKDITADPPATLFPQPVTVTLTEGTFLVELLATNDDDLNPNGWTYDVSFGLTISNKPTPFAAFPIAVPEGPEGSPVDLAVVAPLAASGGTVIIRGVGLPDIADAAAGQVVGFDGTTTAWVDQTGEGGVGTQGPKGDQGDQGPKGDKGDKGDQGDPGVPGSDGADGSDGAPGADGADGKSAYEVAVDEGFVGNEAAWLDSLVGPEGPQGETGDPGEGGIPAVATETSAPATILKRTLNYTFDAADPDLVQFLANGKQVAVLNEWGAARYRLGAYPTYADAATRYIREDGDNAQTIPCATELVDRRTGATFSTLWGRKWKDGTLMRNDVPMADSYVTSDAASDTNIANLPVGTIVIELD